MSCYPPLLARKYFKHQNISGVSATGAGPGYFSGLQFNNNLTDRSSSQWDKLRCQCCGSLVTDENCEDCGSYFSSEDQRRLELESQEVLAATSSSDCSSVLEAVSSLSSRLGDGHQLLLQAQTAVLQHVSTCRACSDNQLTLGVLSEIARARLSILDTSLDLPSCYR